MIDHEQRIIDALKEIPGLGWISEAWPDAQTRLPCIVVSLTSERVIDRRDGKPYLVELEYYVRIFAAAKPVMREILAEADHRMENIGYERTFRFEQNEPGVKQWITRYKAVVRADG